MFKIRRTYNGRNHFVRLPVIRDQFEGDDDSTVWKSTWWLAIEAESVVDALRLAYSEVLPDQEISLEVVAA